MVEETRTFTGLRASGLNKRYGAVQALVDVEFEVKDGEVVALLGENGAGKSTLVKVLSGLVVPDSGKVEIDGSEVDVSTSARSQSAGIAVVQQEYSTVPALSVAENLMLGKAGSPLLWSRRRLHAEARPLLEAVGLSEVHPATKVEDLSVAEMQLLEIARVLARDARVVIFDEPTAALSDVEAQRVLGVVRDLAARGIGVVYVTHRLPEVFAIADRVAVFRNGRSLPPIAVKDTTVEEVIRLMIGRELDTMFPERAKTPGDEHLRMDQVLIAGMASPVSLAARKGEVLGVTGQLGSGADLIVKALAGEAPVLAGEIRIDGSELKATSRAAGLDQNITYCSPDRKRSGIFANLSILQNMSSPWLDQVASGGMLRPRRESARAREYAASFAIDVKRMSASVGHLSGGNQQKVVLAKWLGNAPTLFLVEEPTRGVDVGARSEIYTKLRELCAEGMTVVVASSDAAEVLGLCDTIAAFYHGELVATRPADQWTDDELVAAVMNRSAST